MTSKSIIAVAIAIVVVIAAASVILVLNGNNPAPEKTDDLRTDLAVGDYIEYTQQMTMSSESSMSMEESSFYSALYPDLSYCQVIGTETITFKGQKLVCDVYQMGTAYIYYYVHNGISYGNAMGSPDNMMKTYITDTSLDLTKTAKQQKVVAGDFIKSSTDVSGTVLTTILTAKTYDSEAGEWDVSIRMYTIKPVSDTEKETIEKIDGETVYILKKDYEVSIESTATEFLSKVSFKTMLKYLESGTKYSLGEKSTATITTPYGERQVTAQKITANLESENPTVGTIYYCDDLIYEFEMHSSGIVVTYKLVSTSLVTPAN